MGAMNLQEKILSVKNKIGKISKTETNPFFKSKYMDLGTLLEALEPLLIEAGLLLTQPIKDNQVSTIIQDAKTPEQSVRSSLTLPEITDPQKIGSCITYYRRYTLKSLLAIQEEDDDGNKAASFTKKLITLTYPGDNFSKCRNHLKGGGTISDLEKKYSISQSIKEKLMTSLLEDGKQY